MEPATSHLEPIPTLEARQQHAVALFALEALSGADGEVLGRVAAEAVAEGLGVPYAATWHLQDARLEVLGSRGSALRPGRRLAEATLLSGAEAVEPTARGRVQIAVPADSSELVVMVADCVEEAMLDLDLPFVQAIADLLAAALIRGARDGVLDGRVTAEEARERAEQARFEAERRARAGERLEALGRLAGGVAHELDNLLSVVVSSAELVLVHRDDPGQVERDVSRILAAAQRGAEVSRQLLAFGRGDPGEPAQVDVGARLFELEPLALDAPPAPAPAVSRGPDGPATILVVEDEPALRDFVRRALERAGHEVLEAANGAEALEVAARAPSFDLLLTDVVMPGLGGPALAERLAEDRPSLCILFMTGYAGRDRDDRLRSAHVLGKPFKIADLLQAVHDVLALREPAS